MSKYGHINLVEAGLEDMTEEELAFILGDLPSQVRDSSPEPPEKRYDAGYQFPEERYQQERYQQEERYLEGRFAGEGGGGNHVDLQEAECPLCQRMFPMAELQIHAENCGLEEEKEQEGGGGYEYQGFNQGYQGGFNEGFNGGFNRGFNRGFQDEFQGGYEEERREYESAYEDQDAPLWDRRKGWGQMEQGYSAPAEVHKDTLTCDVCSSEHPSWQLHMLDNCNHKGGTDCLVGHLRRITQLGRHDFGQGWVCPVRGCGRDVSWRDFRTLVSSEEYCKFSLALEGQLEGALGSHHSAPESKRASLGDLRSALQRLHQKATSEKESPPGAFRSPSHHLPQPAFGLAQPSVWTRGTGFGGPQDRRAGGWDTKSSKEGQRRDQAIEAELASVERALIAYTEAGYVDSAGVLYDIACQGLLMRSVLGKVVMEYLRNDSLHDIATTRFSFYMVLFALVRALARNPLFYVVLDDHDKIKLEYERSQSKGGNAAASQGENGPYSGNEILTLLKKQRVQADVFVNSMYREESLQNDDDGCAEILTIVAEFRDLFLLVESALQQWASATNQPAGGEIVKKSADPIDLEKENYVPRMQDLQFKMVEIDKQTHSFASHIAQKTDQLGGKERSKRLNIEIPSLSTSLPLYFDSGIHLRVDEGRPDVMKVLIIGSEGTPYHNGCFAFDIFIPQNYPSVPPMVQLTTTGNGSVRFNPNLYNCGKVCLSLLGTWQGPGWDPKLSTLLQVFMSIQSLILVPDPYYNEPGYENHRNEPASLAYNQNIRQETIRVAMSDMLKKPVPEFQDVIEAHFALKKHSIIKQCDDWLAAQPQLQNVVGNFKALLAQRFP